MPVSAGAGPGRLAGIPGPPGRFCLRASRKGGEMLFGKPIVATRGVFSIACYVAIGYVLVGVLSAWPESAQAGVIAHWTFDVDGSDSVGVHHGTLEGDATITAGEVGAAGEALLLDGDGDFMQVSAYSPEFELTSGAISLWFRGGPSSQQSHGGGFYALVDLHHGTGHGTEGHGWAVLGSVTEDRIGLAGHLAIVNFFGANALLDDGEWHHFVATFEGGGSATLYVDGVFAASAPFPGFTFIDETEALTIGRWGAAVDQGQPANARDFLGWLDDVQIYDEPLGSPEVDYLYNNPGRVVPSSIPTVSSWGLVAMTLLLLTSATIVLSRRGGRELPG